MQQVGQFFSGEFPLEGPGNLLVVFLKGSYPLSEIDKGKEVIGREHFSLEDGEIDFDLVQPTGVDGEMDNNDLGPLALKSIDRGQSPVRRPVVENPENPSGGAVRLACHHVLDQAVEGYDPGFGLAPSEQLCPSHVPGCQIAQCPFSCIFKFHLLSLSRSWTKTLVFSEPCLNTGLFVSRDDKVARPQGESIPYPLIKIQDPACLMLKLGITGKDPAPVLPWLNGILSQPPPDRRAAHVSHNAPLNSCSRNFAGAPSRQRNTALKRQFTRQGLYLDDDVRGKNRTGVRVWIYPPALRVVHRKISSATCSRPDEADPTSARSYRSPYPRRPLKLPWPGPPNNKVTYISGQSFPVRHARPPTTQLERGFSLASNPPLLENICQG